MSIVFVWFVVPETGKERTFDEINNYLDSMCVWGGTRPSGINAFSFRPASYGSWGLLHSDDITADDGLSPTPSPEEVVTNTARGSCKTSLS